MHELGHAFNLPQGGIGLGSIQAATPLVFWRVDSSTVYALGLAAIAAISSASRSPTDA